MGRMLKNAAESPDALKSRRETTAVVSDPAASRGKPLTESGPASAGWVRDHRPRPLIDLLFRWPVRETRSSDETA